MTYKCTLIDNAGPLARLLELDLLTVGPCEEKNSLKELVWNRLRTCAAMPQNTNI